MKPQRLNQLMVSLGLLSLIACAHYDVKRPLYHSGNHGPNMDDSKSGPVVLDPSIPSTSQSSTPVAVTPDNTTIPSTSAGTTTAGTTTATTTPAGTTTTPAGTTTTPAGTTTATTKPADTTAGTTTPGTTQTAPKTGTQTTPASGPVHVQTYDEAIKAVNDAKAKDANLNKYQLGAGYDLLTGARGAICMSPATLGTTVTPRNETSDTYNIAHSYSDLYQKLETEFGADVGGIYQIFTGSLSVKTKIMQETHVTSDDVVIIAGFSYLKDRISVGNTGADYAEYFSSLSQKNKTLFRKYCGDRFTKDVSTGATMYMVFTAKKLDSTSHDQTSVEAAIKVGLAGILNLGVSASSTSEQKAILNSYSFSTKCYTTGTSVDICGGFSGTTAFDINSDANSMQKKIADSHQKLLDEVRAGNNLTVIKETMLDYDVPVSACTNDGSSPCPSRWDYFVDYRDRLGKLKSMSVSREESDDVCSKISYMPHRCARVSDLFEGAINACRGFDSACSIPNDNEYRTILSAENPGWVEMWDNDQFRGNYWSIDFRNFIAGSPYSAYNLFVFKNIGLGKANDKITSFKTHLYNGWTIKWYHDTDPKNPGKHYDVTGSQDVGNVGKDNNDRFSSFLLIPPGDL